MYFLCVYKYFYLYLFVLKGMGNATYARSEELEKKHYITYTLKPHYSQKNKSHEAINLKKCH